MSSPHISILQRLLNLMSKKYTYTAAAADVLPPDAPTPDQGYKTDYLLEAFRYLETRGEKNPYGFYQPSGSPISGDALGAYQVTEAKLKEQSKKVLGREVTRDEFLADPSLQDEFMRGLIDKRFVGEFKFDLPTIFAAHRGGFSDLDKMPDMVNNYKQYTDEGVKFYQNRLKQNEEIK